VPRVRHPRMDLVCDQVRQPSGPPLLTRGGDVGRPRGERHGLAERVPMPTLTYRPVPERRPGGGRPGLPHGGDDVGPVGLDLRFLVAVHEIEVEVVDAGVGELAELGDLLVGAAEDAEAIGHLVADERGVR
jgi:hypothetical protein